MPSRSKWQSLPTEAVNPRTLSMDRASTEEIIDLMLHEDRKTITAVQHEKERIAIGAELITQAFRNGGRLVFVGAGTSGRLGVLEAAEMLPTFGTPPRLVQAVMAGGRDAFFKPREGVEDNFEEGARAVSRLRLTGKDVLIGVSASGMTQFVRGALTRARRGRVKIVFVTCWPGTELQTFVDVIIAPAVGPEVIAGSTRLKAGKRHQDGAQHVDHDLDGPHRQDLWQPDGRRADRVRATTGPGVRHHHDGNRARLRGCRGAAAAGALEREGRHRDGEDR